MPVTIKDIAQAAGVDERTVRRALHGTGYVGQKTRDRILRIISDLDYQPNRVARSLVTGKSGLIGVVIRSRLVVDYHACVQPTERAIQQAGCSMLFYTFDDSPGGEKWCLEQLIQNRVDGAIVFPGEVPADLSTYQSLVDTGAKLVIIDRVVEGLDVPQLHSDSYSPSRLATDYLISLGHRNIVFLAMPETTAEGRERARGFREAMAEAGIPVTEDSMVETGLSVTDAAKVMTRLLKRKNPPTGIVTRHDIVAWGAMSAVLAAGLSVPDDISIVGNGDVWSDNTLPIPLTTTVSPQGPLWETGVGILHKMLAGETVDARDCCFDLQLIKRASCAPPKQA